MELSYDKYERRFQLSLDVPLWLDRLFHPYQDCVEDAELHRTVIEQHMQEAMELAAYRMLAYPFTDPLPRSNGTTYTMTRYKDAAGTLFDPAPPMGQE